MAYTLNCFILGAEDTFTVKIKKTQSVGELKDEVKRKNEPKFNHLVAHEFTLHQIYIDISNDAEYANKLVEIPQPGYVFDPKNRLNAPRMISSYFGKPSDRSQDAIHVLVELPQRKSIHP